MILPPSQREEKIYAFEEYRGDRNSFRLKILSRLPDFNNLEEESFGNLNKRKKNR
jgi:hypothetical protein